MTIIAILGATGHISRSLMATRPERLCLYARRPEAVTAFLVSEGLSAKRMSVAPLEAFADEPCDVVINAVGLGQPGKVAAGRYDFFRVTERVDNLVLDRLAREQRLLYLFLSSGAVYGNRFVKPADFDSQLSVPVNQPDPQSFYGLAKLNAEVKHRSRPDLNIVDIRVFGYISRFIDLDGNLLLSELARALIQGREFVTAPDNIVRDYAAPTELNGLIDACINAWQRVKVPLNGVVDLRSREPVDKFFLLDGLVATLGLRYRVDQGFVALQATGSKSLYYSSLECLPDIAWQASRTAYEVVVDELKGMLQISIPRQVGAGP